jgi:hypothetical protein
LWRRRRARSIHLRWSHPAAALFAVANFRRVLFARLLYGGDDVGGEVWQELAWDMSPRERMFWLAAEACLTL